MPQMHHDRQYMIKKYKPSYLKIYICFQLAALVCMYSNLTRMQPISFIYEPARRFHQKTGEKAQQGHPRSVESRKAEQIFTQ